MAAVSAPTNREVLALALPALGALAAEPLYVLGDTAIVGHIGTHALAGLALGGLLLSEILGLCAFFEYGTTARAARLYGAGDHEAALDVGVQATWMALGLGLLMVGMIEALAGPSLSLLAGGSSAARGQAVEWMRVAALGSPFVLLTAAAQGWLRAFQDTRTPLIVIAAANVVSIVISFTLVTVLGVGLVGSAIANVVAQALSGGLLTLLLVRRASSLKPVWERMRAQLRAAANLTLRTAAFFAAFTAATGVASRMDSAGVHVAAHQIGFQLWILLALVLDATAIAAQALIGSMLGAGAVDAARALAWRLVKAGLALGIGFAVVLLIGHHAIPRLFTDDRGVLAQTAVLWPWFVAMLPANGVLFALDGVLLGAGDLRFMRNATIAGALLGYLPLALATATDGWGLTGIWLGLSSFIWIRLVAGLWRWRSARWLVAGTRMVDEAV